MKIAFRNFLTTLRRYKISSLLNVIGLTLAFTAFYVIMKYRFEQGHRFLYRFKSHNDLFPAHSHS